MLLSVTLAATLVALATPVDDLDDELKAAHAALPKTVGTDLANERPAVEAAIKLADRALVELEAQKGPFAEVLQKNATALKEDASAVLAAIDILEIVGEIKTLHAADKLADGARYVALQTAVGEFAERGTRWQSIYLWLVAHRRAVDGGKLKLERVQQMRAAFAAVNLAHRTLERSLLDEVGRVARERLVDLDNKATALAAFDEAAATWYRHERQRLAIEDAWRIPVPADRDITVSSLLKAELLDAGGTRGKRLKASFKLVAGHCAGVLFRFQKSLVGEGLSDLRFESRAKRPLRRFSQVTSGAGWQRTEGVCATVDDTVTVRANIERGERGNVLDFIVVEWAPDQDLSAVLPALVVHLDDRCDDALVREMWLNPVRGSVVFSSEEPVLLTAIESEHVVVIDIGGARKRIATSALGSPRPLAFKTPFSFKACGPGAPTTRDAKKFTSCVERVHARFEKKLAAAGFDDADALLIARDAEEAQKCGAMEKRIETRLRVNYDRILDDVAATPRTPSVDRGAQLRARAAARTDIR